MTGIVVEVSGIADVKRLFSALIRHGKDLTEPMAAVGMRLEERINLRFDTKTDPTGSAWAPLATSTKARYATLDFNPIERAVIKRGSLLIRSGLMRASLSHVATENSVVVGFGSPHAVYHEFGTRRMPRRGLIFAESAAGTLSRDDVDAIEKVLIKWFESHLRG